MADTGFSITRGPAKWAMVGTLGIATAGAIGWALFSRGSTPPLEVAREPQSVVVPAEPPAPVLVARPQPDPRPDENAPDKVGTEVQPKDPGVPATTEEPPVPLAPEPRVVDRTPFGPSVMEGGGPEKAPKVEESKHPAAAPESQQVQKEPVGAPPERVVQRAPTLVTPRRINVNTATKAELELLPSVGPAIADRIIEARTKKRFTSYDDLDRVRGIGPKLLEKIKGRITFVDEVPSSKPGK